MQELSPAPIAMLRYRVHEFAGRQAEGNVGQADGGHQGPCGAPADRLKALAGRFDMEATASTSTSKAARDAGMAALSSIFSMMAMRCRYQQLAALNGQQDERRALPAQLTEMFHAVGFAADEFTSEQGQAAGPRLPRVSRKRFGVFSVRRCTKFGQEQRLVDHGAPRRGSARRGPPAQANRMARPYSPACNSACRSFLARGIDAFADDALEQLGGRADAHQPGAGWSAGPRCRKASPRGGTRAANSVDGRHQRPDVKRPVDYLATPEAEAAPMPTGRRLSRTARKP